MVSKTEYNEGVTSNVIVGYSSQHSRLDNEIRRIIRNLLIFVIISLLIKKFAMNEIPTWYFTRHHPTSEVVQEPGANMAIFDQVVSDFNEVNTVNVKRLVLFLLGCLCLTVPFFS